MLKHNLLGLLLLTAATAVASWAGQGVEKLNAVASTYDGRPFSYQIQPLREGSGYRVYRLSYPSPIVTAVPQNNTIPAEFFLPTGVRDGVKRPAVVCLHILQGNFELERITCSVLAAQGIAAIMIKLPYYGERGLPDGVRALAENPKLFVGALDQGIHDVRRTVDILASRPEVDSAAIGVVGISMGGISAATVAEQEPRIARAALILAGGNLPYIIDHARETTDLSQRIHSLAPAERNEVEQAIRQHDPLRYAQRLRPRAEQGRVIMINASADRVIAPQCTRELAAALGLVDKVQWLDGLGHYTAIAALPQVLDRVADFFAQDLTAAARPIRPKQSAAGPLQTVGSLLGQMALLLGPDPQPGRGHLVDLKGSVTLGTGKPLEFQGRLIRGSGGRFRLEAQAPVVGDIALGQTAYPWLLAHGGTVFKGRPATESPPLRRDDANLLKLRLLAGTLSGMALSPQIVEQLVSVRDATTPAGPALRIATRDGRPREALLWLQADRVTPKRLEISADQTRVEISFRHWQVNTVAPDELFVEPHDGPCQEVDAVDIQHMYAALLSFAMEQLP
jgi:dienelactone hydrolase